MIPGVSSDTTVISGIALEIVDGGTMDQVVISNITMTGVQTPLFIKLGSRKGVGIFRNVVISNITATDESLMTSSITGVPGGYIENFILKDIIFNCRGTAVEVEADAPVPERNSVGPDNRMFGYSLPAYGLYLRHVKNLQFEDFRFNLLNPDARPAIVMDDCHGIRISNFSAARPDGNRPLIRIIQSEDVTLSGFHSTEKIAKFVQVEGNQSGNIKLSGNDFSQVGKAVTKGDGCKSRAIRKSSNL
jgi:hypothetical protein